MRTRFVRMTLFVTLAIFVTPASVHAAVITTTDPEVGDVVQAEPEFRDGQAYGPDETVSNDGDVELWTCPRDAPPRYVGPTGAQFDEGECNVLDREVDAAGNPTGVRVLGAPSAGLVIYATEVAAIDRNLGEGPDGTVRYERFHVHRLSEPLDVRPRPANPEVTLSHRKIKLRGFAAGGFAVTARCSSACIARNYEVVLAGKWARRLFGRPDERLLAAEAGDHFLTHSTETHRWYPGGGSATETLQPGERVVEWLRRARRLGAERLKVRARMTVVPMNMPLGTPPIPFSLPLTIRLSP